MVVSLFMGNNNWIVQRLTPFGGALQAKATRVRQMAVRPVDFSGHALPLRTKGPQRSLVLLYCFVIYLSIY